MDQIGSLNAVLAGRYEIAREIGAGGMATVYLARDVKHDRQVALKVLKPELGAVLGVERFLAEIKVTANLQHPNLLPLFDSGEAGGLLFYVMPYVEGESLRARLDREKQLPVEEAVRIAVAVASALDYAHRHGVIHRDLKPENVLLHEGQPLIADFGIALAVSNAGGARVTQTGLSLGTPQYMSPEQAAGDRVIDGRSDIYSLGAMLYEMLTGEPPHSGTTVQAIVAKVLTERPRGIRRARTSVPVHVEAAVDRALEKLPADRPATARDFAEMLQGKGPALALPAAAGTVPAKHAPATRASRLRALAPWALAVLALAGWTWQSLRSRPSAPQRARFVLTLSDSARLRSDIVGVLIAISPDGSRIAFVGGASPSRVFLRTIDDLAIKPVPGTENASGLQFSPDGKWLAFLANNRLKKLPLAGGPTATIIDGVVSYSWGANDIVVFSRPSGPGAGLWRVSAAGGTAERLTRPDLAKRETGHIWPHVLPDGAAAVFAIRFGSAETDSLATVRLKDGQVTRLGIQGTNPRFVASGMLLFGRTDGTVTAASFDPRTLRVTSALVPVLENVLVRTGSTTGGSTNIAISENGSLAYAQGRTEGQVVRVERSGRAQLLRPEMTNYGDPRFSPDGKRLVMVIRSAAGAPDLWILTVADGGITRLTNDGGNDRPAWTPDGRRIAWRTKGAKTAYDVKWAAYDGGSAPEVLVSDAWSADFAKSGRFFVVNTVRDTSSSDIDMIAQDSTHRRTLFVGTPSTEVAERVSPDGAWVAFASNQSSRYEVYVKAASGPSGVHRVSTDGGHEPVWSPDGHELFFRTGSKLVAATISTKPEFAVVRRDPLFDDVYQLGSNFANYDVAPDGRSFVMVKPANAGEPPVVVLNWLDELRERMKQVARK